MTHLDLFSGIGGFALAARWAGFTTTQFVEWEAFPQRVLAKNFPGVPIHGDIRTFDATHLQRPALVTGGFPCQDISPAGKGAGIEGERSGLWGEMLRVVSECRPLWMVAENSHSHRVRGGDRVLGDLERIGYTGRAIVVAAANAGAPHLRRRAFIVAADSDRLRELQRQGAFTLIGGRDLHSAEAWGLASCAEGEQDRGLLLSGLASDTPAVPAGRRLAADSDGVRAGDDWGGRSVRNIDGHGAAEECGRNIVEPRPLLGCPIPWRDLEPPVPGVDAGLSGRVDRAKGLGNCVVPQVAYPILAAIAREVSP